MFETEVGCESVRSSGKLLRESWKRKHLIETHFLRDLFPGTPFFMEKYCINSQNSQASFFIKQKTKADGLDQDSPIHLMASTWDPGHFRIPLSPVMTSGW